MTSSKGCLANIELERLQHHKTGGIPSDSEIFYSWLTVVQLPCHQWNFKALDPWFAMPLVVVVGPARHEGFRLPHLLQISLVFPLYCLVD